MSRNLTFGYLYGVRNPEQWLRPWADLHTETLDVAGGAWVPEHHLADDGYKNQLITNLMSYIVADNVSSSMWIYPASPFILVSCILCRLVPLRIGNIISSDGRRCRRADISSRWMNRAPSRPISSHSSTAAPEIADWLARRPLARRIVYRISSSAQIRLREG